MGIKLIVEVLDHAPDHLTHRELLTLVAFAETANDGTRQCWPGVEDDERIIRRLRMSRTARYKVIKALIDKGALVRIRRGQKGVRAVYGIPVFAQRPENRDPEPTVSVPETGTLKAAQRPDSGTSASRFQTFSVPETGTPSPQSPQDPSSLSAAISAMRTAGLSLGQEDEREFFDWINKNNNEPGPGWWRTLANNGDLRAHAAKWQQHRNDQTRAAEQADRQAEINACAWCDTAGWTHETPARRCDHLTPPPESSAPPQQPTAAAEPTGPPPEAAEILRNLRVGRPIPTASVNPQPAAASPTSMPAPLLPDAPTCNECGTILERNGSCFTCMAGV